MMTKHITDDNDEQFQEALMGLKLNWPEDDEDEEPRNE
jgi:hypothetical protein